LVRVGSGIEGVSGGWLQRLARPHVSFLNHLVSENK
jgi:hypothetical protein